jgi:hypothetical protein
MFAPLRRTAPAALAVAALALAGAAPAMAQHGADDPAGDDHGRHSTIDHREVHRSAKAHAAKHGADDKAGHRRHGADDGPNHR